jgi:peptide deformylase
MAKVLPTITNPNPILRKKSNEVKAEEIRHKDFVQLILDMEKTMETKDGAGLAAPQIGKNIRLIVLRHEEESYIMINPQITKKSWSKDIDEEGCLSVLNEKGEILYGPIERHKKINCVYTDFYGKKQKMTASDLLARIIQHEVDHLDGILFIDYIKDLTILKPLTDEKNPAKIDLSQK